MAARLIITKYCKATQMPIYVNELWYTHTLDYYSAGKMNKLAVMTHNMNESQKHNLSKRSHILKKHILYNFSSIKYKVSPN